MTTSATLCYIVKDGRTLLLKKREGLRGGGKWNAPGGKLLPDETPKEGVVRELLEETGLTIKNPQQKGKLSFYVEGRDEPDWVVYVFRVGGFSGNPRPSQEGYLEWHGIDDLPYPDMWEVDRLWLPVFIEGKTFEADFYFNKGDDRLLCHQIRTVE